MSPAFFTFTIYPQTPHTALSRAMPPFTTLPVPFQRLGHLSSLFHALTSHDYERHSHEVSAWADEQKKKKVSISFVLYYGSAWRFRNLFLSLSGMRHHHTSPPPGKGREDTRLGAVGNGLDRLWKAPRPRPKGTRGGTFGLGRRLVRASDQASETGSSGLEQADCFPQWKAGPYVEV